MLTRVAELHDGPVLVGGGLAGLRTVSNLALSRALRLPVPPADAARAAEFVIAAAGRSTLLVLDDVHLCDPTTLEVLALLAGQLPIVLAVTDDTEPGAQLAAALVGLPCATGVGVAPLPDTQAGELARAAYQGADPEAVRSIVRAAGGNPAALVAMAHDPDAPELRLAVANRLARLGPGPRTVLCLLGLLGRPAESALIGEQLTQAAVRAGVVLVREGWLSARSKLDVEVALAVLSVAQRRALHTQLARRVGDPGEQARHFEAAGDRDAALSAARVATASAVSALERVRYQAIAARATAEPGRGDACLVVALAASDCADHRLAVTMATASGADTDARVALVRARAALVFADAHAALAHLDRLDDCNPDDELTPLVTVERARALCLVDPIEAMGVAADAYAAATSERDRARAGGVLGAAQLAAGADGWLATLEAAQTHAQDCGLDDVAFAAAANRCSGLLRDGRAEEAYALALASGSAATGVGATSWAVHFETVRLWVNVHARAALSEGRCAGEALLDRALAPLLRREVISQVALAYADGGELAAAQAYLGAPDPAAHDLLGWCDAELDALAGDRRRAAAKAIAVLGLARHWPVPTFAALTAAWAGVPGDRGWIEQSRVGGATAELAGLAVRDTDPGRAAELFADAAKRWEGFSRRAVLRCRLSAAVAFANQDRHVALVELRRLAAELEPNELVLLSRQVTRARRDLGDCELPSTPTGPRSAALSRREAEVMAAVAAGATSVAIAARLAVAPSTVETHVKSAMRKLGATTRTEAAVRAQR